MLVCENRKLFISLVTLLQDSLFENKLQVKTKYWTGSLSLTGGGIGGWPCAGGGGGGGY